MLQDSRVHKSLLNFFKNLKKTPSEPQLVTSVDGRPLVLARLPSNLVVDDDPAVNAAQIYGLIKFTVHEATLTEARTDRDYFTTVSIGKQALTSHGAAPTAAIDGELVWNTGATFLLQRNGASIARIAVYQQGRFDGAWSNHLLAWCEVDLATYFTPETVVDDEELGSTSTASMAAREDGEDANAIHSSSGELSSSSKIILEDVVTLVDPEDASKVLGSVRISGKASSLRTLEKQVWESLLLLADFNDDRVLSEEEFSILLEAFGSELDADEVHDIFNSADVDGSGSVDIAELSQALTFLDDGEEDGSVDRMKHFNRLMKRCPVDGAELSPDPDKRVSNLLYVSLALSSARANHEAELKAGYLTEAQAAQSWIFRLSEWASHPLSVTPAAAKLRRDKRNTAGGLRVGAAAAHILVYDRAGQRMVEEYISPVINLALRNMYQSKVGRALMKHGGLQKRLLALSIKEGKYRDSKESAKDILPFVESFRGQIDVSDAQLPLKDYKTFNEFFYRKLKPGSRPVAAPEDGDVVVSSADCRLQVFASVDEATRFWVKGRNFSIAGLLADTDPSRSFSSSFAGGTMAIFRLAPQDYHRYHSPVDGIVVSITPVPGHLLTVNPIAVNSLFCDVFTVNKRAVMIIESPTLGRVAFVAVGATLVGSIFWTATVGAQVNKGDELGYFAFGGSTCIVLFPSGSVTWDADLSANGQKSLETLVKVGEQIGVRKGCGKEEKREEREKVFKRMETMADAQGAKPLEERRELTRLLSGEVDALTTCVMNMPLEEEEEDGEEDV